MVSTSIWRKPRGLPGHGASRLRHEGPPAVAQGQESPIEDLGLTAQLLVRRGVEVRSRVRQAGQKRALHVEDRSESDQSEPGDESGQSFIPREVCSAKIMALPKRGA